MSRRRFLGAAAAGACLAGRAAAGPSNPKPETGGGWPALPPVKIYKVYVGRTGGIYLSRPTEEIARFDAFLAGVEKKLGDVRFIGGDRIPPAQAKDIVPKLRGADGLLIFHLSGHGGGAPVMDRLIDAGLPAAVFSQPFSGHGWMDFPRWRRAGKRVVPLVTSDWGELERIARLMRVPAHMRRTKMLVVRGPQGTAAACAADKVRERLGLQMIPVTVQETLQAHAAVDVEAARAEAERYWIRPAKAIVEPSRDEIVNAARFYLALKGLMQKAGARAVASSNCMGAPAKGCLAFSKLNDQGLVGACEGDIDSALTMLMMAYAHGIPGFISDPVFDTAKSALVHFHCTCATKMDGPGGERRPFTIRTQSDSERGVSLDVEMRIGQVVTCAKFVDLRTLLVSRGDIFDVTHDELGCRTQFWTRVADARAFFENWGGGVLQGGVMTRLHRVVFYGDHLQSFRDLATLMGFDVVREL